MNHDDLARENESLRERISALSAASLRVGASLDLDTVLQEVVESARALTGARYGAIATIDEAGQPRDFVTSGFTEEEHRRMQEWPDGPRLFEYFRDLPGPLRLAEATAHVRALGFDSERLPWGTFQGTPMRHQGGGALPLGRMPALRRRAAQCVLPAQAARPGARAERRCAALQLLLRRMPAPCDATVFALLRPPFPGGAVVPGGERAGADRRRAAGGGRPAVGDPGDDAAALAAVVAGDLPGDAGVALEAGRAGGAAR